MECALYDKNEKGICTCRLCPRRCRILPSQRGWCRTRWNDHGLLKSLTYGLVTSAALAGAAGALYGLNYSSLQAAKFNFNTSILVLVFVVLGGLGNIWGSLVAAAALTILPEALREFADYRMLVYAIVLILVMLATHNPTLQSFFARLKPGKKEEKEAA